MAPEKSTFGTKRIQEAQRLRGGVVMKVRRKIIEFVEMSRAAIARAIGTYNSEAVPKFLYLTVERIQAVAPAAMEQEERQPITFIAIVDLYRTNAGNKWGRL
jgi:hypothetical protein